MGAAAARRRPPAADGDQIAEEVIERLAALVRAPGDPPRLALYRLAAREETLTYVYDLEAEPELSDRLAPHARWLLGRARDRGALNLRIALLACCGDDGDVRR